MKYRAEIDGLRAVAVISVILSHAGFAYFRGGFVGVDVFFVISGYLITTIILSEKEQGTFSLLTFYERRARRILPALFLVLLVSLLFAWLWFIPSDMKRFSDSLVAVSTFSSNILFVFETGYWGAVNDFKPLLHTWSLAVEEQYYVLFPLFLMLMWRFRKRWILGSFMLIAALSFIASEWGAHNKPIPNYFLLPTRGWELAIGAGIAFYFLYRKRTMHALLSHHAVGEMLGLFGLLMIVYAVYAFDATIPFPGFYALIPTIGAGLIILFASPQNLVGRLLGAKVMVGIGLISYSAYLWHQPLFAFVRYRSLTEPGEWLFAVLATLSFPLAYLSWRYVEKPFRNKDVVGRQAIFSFALIGSVAFIAIGLAGHVSEGFKGRSIKNEQALMPSIEEKRRGNQGLSATCDGAFTLSPDCRTSDEPEILVWGDSYAMHLVDGIMASNPDAKIIQMTKSLCGPFFDVIPISYPEISPAMANNCLAFTGKVHEWLKQNKTVKYAVLSSPFAYYFSKDATLLYRNGDLVKANIDLVTKAFEKTLGELKLIGITPVVFSPTPADGNNMGLCLARAEYWGLNLDVCNFRVDAMSQDRRDAYVFLDSIEKNYRVIRLDNFICNSFQCNTHFGSTYIYLDGGHLTKDGSAMLGKIHDFYGMIVGVKH
jgi:peptidoglycan/LPS O-acetylase OafA/YrhL